MHNPEFVVFFRILSALLFFASVYAGYYLFKNYQRLFGVDPNMPSENSSARAYSKIQVFAVWAHILLASGAFALMFH